MRRVRTAPRTADFAADGHVPVVTGLMPDPRAPGFVIVELDGSRFASIPHDAIGEMGIGDGDALELDVFQRLSEVADITAAQRVALRVLAARPRSVFEMRRALRERGHASKAIDRAIQRLQESGLLDDDAYARTFVRIRSTKGHGPSRLLADLRARGVDGRLAERAVREVLEDEDVDLNSQVERLAEKRLGQLHGLPPATRRRRVIAFLGRRGYTGWTVRETVDRLLTDS